MTQQELANTWLPTVTYEQFLKFKPCWLNDRKRATQLKEIGSRKKEWNALDVLRLEEVNIADRMWAVLREEFLSANLLHEYACRCADYALSKIDNPDPRSIQAVEAKRKWMRGEISDTELKVKCLKVWGAGRAVAWISARAAAWVSALAVVQDTVRVVGQATAWNDLLNILINLIKEEEQQ
ncbi:hypothetical protein BN3661_02193 [Eubacteriaceae bacterium CHKCI005]|nr:hypothetical protein BN3661_02193 [Eubacteriaceae bacterium CHKCI005]